MRICSVILSFALVGSAPLAPAAAQTKNSDAQSDHAAFADLASIIGTAPTPQYRLFSSASGRVLVLGVRHSRDFADPQFEQIKDSMIRFSPTIVLNEGGEWPIEESEEATARKSGESAYTRKVASDLRIPYRSFEPSFSDEIAAAKELFPAESLKTYYIVRYSHQLRRLTADERNKALKEYIDLLSIKFGLVGFPYTILDVDDAAQQWLKLGKWRTSTPNDVAPVVYTAAGPQPPKPDDPLPQRISRASNRFRDSFVVNQVSRLVDGGARVMLVYGWGHLLAQERALSCAVEKRCPREGASDGQAR